MATTLERPLEDVYSAAEIAQAVGVPASGVEALVAEGRLSPISPLQPFFCFDQAVVAVRALRKEVAHNGAFLFGRPTFAHAPAPLPVAISSTFHAGIAAFIIFVGSLGSPQASTQSEALENTDMRLVFLALPGPGGGGGGGGLRQEAPPPRALRKGPEHLDSPIPVREAPKPVEPVAKPEPPPPEKPEPEPPVVAPVATVAANERDRPGVINTPAQSESRGPGAGSGAGSGDGSGIGPGSGGGTGDGPYRPGRGITPPQILREVKADYTEDARRRGVEGEVVLEIVVRRDGSVGDVRLVSGLPSGLNDRSMVAVRQWRWVPARRLGQAVDVIVEVAVEFNLR